MKPRRERCVQCDRALQKHRHTSADGRSFVTYGYGGTGYFCSLVCGHAFAVQTLRDVDGWDEESLRVNSK